MGTLCLHTDQVTLHTEPKDKHSWAGTFYRRPRVSKLAQRRPAGSSPLSVLDRASWVRSAILMNVYLDLENPGGSGFWVGGYMSQVREMGKLV
jgi:hypothetical protein